MPNRPSPATTPEETSSERNPPPAGRRAPGRRPARWPARRTRAPAPPAARAVARPCSASRAGRRTPPRRRRRARRPRAAGPPRGPGPRPSGRSRRRAAAAAPRPAAGPHPSPPCPSPPPPLPGVAERAAVQVDRTERGHEGARLGEVVARRAREEVEPLPYGLGSRPIAASAACASVGTLVKPWASVSWMSRERRSRSARTPPGPLGLRELGPRPLQLRDELRAPLALLDDAGDPQTEQQGERQVDAADEQRRGDLALLHLDGHQRRHGQAVPRDRRATGGQHRPRLREQDEQQEVVRSRRAARSPAAQARRARGIRGRAAAGPPRVPGGRSRRTRRRRPRRAEV